MLNLTLTITAAPELLAAMSGFINSITAAKVVTIPQYNSDFRATNISKEQIASAVSYKQPALQPSAYQEQNSSAQQTIKVQEPVQSQVPSSVTPIYNQTNAVPVNTGNNQGVAVPTSAQTYTMEQLAVAATQLVDAGRRTELLGLLSSFGVQALTALPKEQYGTFATQLRALGAKI